jgi:hypothetical protein
MRFLLIVSAGLALSASAVTFDVPRLPAPAYFNWEVSADTALPANKTDNFRVFRLELTFDATPSNNVQVAFGRDTLPGDGFLEPEETDCIIGWDCGEWFLRPQGLRERYASPSAVTDGTRTLTASIRVNAQGAPRTAAFSDGQAAFTFPGLTQAPFPEWLNPCLWTHLRVTARGSSAANETVSVRHLPDGVKILIR